MSNSIAEVAAKVAQICRRPGGEPLAPAGVDLDQLYQFIANWGTGSVQNGGEGKNVDAFNNSLLKGTKYFGNRLCPFANRAYWALADKGLLEDGTIEYVHVNLGATKPAWYKDHVYSKGTVPAVVDGGRVLGESALVAEYLEEKYPDRAPRLMPTDAMDRGAVRFVVKIFDGGLSSLYGVLMNKDPSADNDKIKAALTFLRDIESIYEKQSAGPFFLGDTFSLADLSLLPFLHRFSVLLPFYRGVDLLNVEGEDFPRLKGLLDVGRTLPGFTKTVPAPEFLAAAYFEYAGGSFAKKV